MRPPLHAHPAAAGITRREALRLGLAGAAGAALGGRATWARASVRPPTARSVIQIWMWGGPSHLDTFDPKPEAGYDYCGPLDAPIPTNVDGIRIGQMLPLLAQQADKYSIIRSMTHGVNGHETASYMVQTGRAAGTGMVYPCAGAVVSLFKGYDAGYKGLIPPYVVLTKPQGRFSEAGFLGPRYKPFATGGNPAQARFVVEGVDRPASPTSGSGTAASCSTTWTPWAQSLADSPRFAEMQQCRAKAYDLILGDAGKVFDLSREDETLRDRYGRNTFGQSCLMARRLVGTGRALRHHQLQGVGHPQAALPDHAAQAARNWTRAWPPCWRICRIAGCSTAPSSGGAASSDARPRSSGSRRGTADAATTARCFSVVLAGGGFQGGQVVGASDARGENVAERPVYPCDLIGSMYELLGIAPDARLPHPQGLDVRVMPGPDEAMASGGLLREIM